MANIYDSLQPVKSSMFSRAGYDDGTWQLLFEFSSTHEIRAYQQVSPEVADECLSAESLGKWFNANIKGNPAWSFEVLGADPNAPPPAKAEKKEPAKKQAQPELGISEEDIRAVDPTYGLGPMDGSILFHDDGEKHHGGSGRIQSMVLEPSNAGDVTMQKLQDTFAKTVQPDQIKYAHATEVADWPQDFGVKEFDPQTGHWPSDAVNEDGTVKEEAIAAMATQPKAELLGKWTAPESAAEALELLSERETEINAIIESCKEAGQAALAVKVTDEASKQTASETLERLVEQKDKSVELLDPFRKVLHEAYTYAQQKGRAAADPLDTGVKHVKAQILAYNQAQERIRQALIQKARDEAAAEEKRRQEAESQRLTLLEMEDKLEQGDEAGAQTLFEQPIQAPRQYVEPQYIPPAATKVANQSTSSKWKVDESAFEGDDEALIAENRLQSVMTILAAVRDGKYDIRSAAAMLWWDMPACNKLAGALRNAFFVPGLIAKPVDSLSVRRKKG